MSAETTTETHKTMVTIGTYFGEPWLYLSCTDCSWRLGYAAEMDPAELAAAATKHQLEATR